MGLYDRDYYREWLDGQKKNQKFLNNLDQLIELKDGIIFEQCEAVAFELTGDYWVSLYDIIQGYLEFIVATISNGYPVRRQIQ